MEENFSAKKEKKDNTGVLSLVSIPIGNKEDITLRALRILKSADIILCESIKEGARLLRHYNISKKLEILDEQNEYERSQDFIALLRQGKNLALISDAGTPVFEDPGFHFVKYCLDGGIRVDVLPGATSIMTALVRSGFPIKQFLYAGLLSRNKDERIAQLKRLSEESRTVVFLETPYRLMPILEAATSVMPDRKAYLGMNLTYLYETHHYGTFRELYEKFSKEKFKGEFVVCFEGAPYSQAFSKKRYSKASRFKGGKREGGRDSSRDKNRPYNKGRRNNGRKPFRGRKD